MRFVNRPIAATLALAALALAPAGAARAADYEADGFVYFTNVQQGTQVNGVVPYFAFGSSGLIGPHLQTGSIRNLTGLQPVNATTFTFRGEVGPHPWLPGHPRVHVISTADGDIYCTWTAVFTLRIINAAGDAVFSGDGDFTVIGGTRRYRRATGQFRTLFETDRVPFGANDAFADYSQSGTIRRN